MEKIGRVLLFFCLDVGLIVSKILKQALVFNKIAVMGYAIDNNILECHVWESVIKLVQDTTNDNLNSRIKHRVGHMNQDEKKRRSKRKEDESDYEEDKSNDEDSSDDSSADQDMDEVLIL
jgi:hypothetical protein